MKCDFSATTQEGDVRLDGQVVPKKDTFRYLGSMLQKDGVTAQPLWRAQGRVQLKNSLGKRSERV
jgi:hypothetical protein